MSTRSCDLLHVMMQNGTDRMHWRRLPGYQPYTGRAGNNYPEVTVSHIYWNGKGAERVSSLNCLLPSHEKIMSSSLAVTLKLLCIRQASLEK